jgi:hypothetical protein
MSFRDRQFSNQQGINQYVPGMQWASCLDIQKGSTFSLGKPVAPITPVVINFAIGTNLNGFPPAPIVFADTPYGRNIVVGITTAPTGGTAIKVFGEDYLGQPMTEQFVIGGATGKKAFYRVLGATVLGTTSVAGAINITQGALLGIPYKGTVEWAREGNPPVLIDPGTVYAKCVLADTTDPATAVTGDTRGMYTPTATPDGLKEFVVNLRPDTSINAANNGGLHGIRQFNG